MRRDYTKIGEKEGFTRDAINRGIDTITEWIELRGKTSLPMMQGMAIQAAIKQLHLPKVSHVAVFGGFGDGYGLYGIKAHYKNADVTLYIADSGTEVIPVAADVEERRSP